MQSFKSESALCINLLSYYLASKSSVRKRGNKEIYKCKPEENTLNRQPGTPLSYPSYSFSLYQ